jgi:UDP-N-acetylglucosamine--N-acetylmuramyl-(pentapeptide) pyrophosphoryl-undecaprenol N-acetylglucosamine transferase
MAAALVAADLLVGRAGSSTLAEAAALGLPMVVVPYPHAAAHQAVNAEEVVAGGAATLVRDEDFDGDALLAASALLADDAARERLSRAARALGRPGAARATAEIVEALAERREPPSPERLETLTRSGAPDEPREPDAPDE